MWQDRNTSRDFWEGKERMDHGSRATRHEVQGHATFANLESDKLTRCIRQVTVEAPTLRPTTSSGPWRTGDEGCDDAFTGDRAKVHINNSKNLQSAGTSQMIAEVSKASHKFRTHTFRIQTNTNVYHDGKNKYMQFFRSGIHYRLQLQSGWRNGINFRYSHSRGGGTERP